MKCYVSTTRPSETLSAPQNKYKEEGKKEMSSSLYSQLPETTEMQLAKTVHEFQSEVLGCYTAALCQHVSAEPVSQLLTLTVADSCSCRARKTSATLTLKFICKELLVCVLLLPGLF